MDLSGSNIKKINKKRQLNPEEKCYREESLFGLTVNNV